MVTTKSLKGFYRSPKMTKIGPKEHNKLGFRPNGKKSLGQRPKPYVGHTWSGVWGRGGHDQ